MNAPSKQSPFARLGSAERTEGLHGDVHLNVPLSWQLISYFLAAVLVVALTFLFTASYSRAESVEGTVVLSTGVAAIVPTRRGIVVALPVRAGQRVRAGDPLAQIRAEEDLRGGETAPERIIGALHEQDRRLSSQAALLIAAAEAEQSRLTSQIKGLEQEISSLDSQITDQQHLVAIAENDYRDSQSIAAKGFVSRRELNNREAMMVSRRQQVSELRQQRAAKIADFGQARRAIAAALATGRGQAESVQSSRATVAQQLAGAEAAQGYTIRSPVDGIVTAEVARLGQPVSTDTSLMTILPAAGRPRVELYVPTSAAGFLALHQEVRLAVDSFPYQRFGTVSGTVSEISSAAISKSTADGRTVPVYLVVVELPRPWVAAFGRQQPLLPGMTLTARIITQKQSLFEWLFEPLFAVSRR